MWPKYFLTSMIVLTTAIVGTLLYSLFGLDYLSWISSCIILAASLMALYYLYYFGSLRHSRWRISIFLLIALYIIAALAKIQHWPIANILAPVAYAGIAAAYTIWFFRKLIKYRLDYLKLVAVLSYTLTGIVKFLHWPLSNGHWLTIFTIGVLQIAYIYLYLWQRRDLLSKKRIWDLDTLQ